MIYGYLFVCSMVLLLCSCDEDLVLVSRTQTSLLEKYQSYKDVLMIHLKVPQDTIFASFRFSADETEMRSIIAFGCKPRNVSLYMKHGAPAVINPDGSPFPKDFKEINRSETYSVQFLSDKKEVYINITSPEPGYYYAGTFLSYSDPRFNKIKQQGRVVDKLKNPQCPQLLREDCLRVLYPFIRNHEVLKQGMYIDRTCNFCNAKYVQSKKNLLGLGEPKDLYEPEGCEWLSPNCFSTVDATLYVKKLTNPIIVSESDRTQVIGKTGESRYFKFYVPINYDRARISVEDVKLAGDVKRLVMRVQINKPPSETSYQDSKDIYGNMSTSGLMLWVRPDGWHYIECTFEGEKAESSSTLSFKLKFYTDKISDKVVRYDFLENKTLYNNSVSKTFHTTKLTDLIPYKEYNLVRESSSETFLFSYQLQEEIFSHVGVPINMTNEHFSLMKFRVKEGTDVGGTLHFIIAYKPRVQRVGSKIIIRDEPKDHFIVACVRRDGIEVPTWPSKCVFNGVERPAQLVLNKTTDNTTILIPYPEAGEWYATFKLFCGDCTPCDCPNSCQAIYRDCLSSCDRDCIASDDCNQCATNCSAKTVESPGCGGCDCDGPCLRDSTKSCNSSIVFDVGSEPCVFGRCSKNGRCMFLVSDGVVFSTCVCTNKYRGWDCSDDSQANAFGMVVFELILLVFSNMAFLPGVYIAYKRKYYIEALVYSAICFFSTFYHACDAGENQINFCLVRIDALQFGDFFCALLAIWVTLVAMADLPQLWCSICHMAGAIVLAFCVTINKAALWIFALPTITGLSIVAVMWYLKYRKVRQRFGDKRYLTIYVPVGGLTVSVGLILYAFLQTEDNYKYLHSLWHILVALSVTLVLPKPDTFHPEVLL